MAEIPWCAQGLHGKLCINVGRIDEGVDGRDGKREYRGGGDGVESVKNEGIAGFWKDLARDVDSSM